MTSRILPFLLTALLLGSLSALADDRDRERERFDQREHHRDGDERHFRGDRDHDYDDDWEDDKRHFRKDRNRDLDDDWEEDERDFRGDRDRFRDDDDDDWEERGPRGRDRDRDWDERDFDDDDFEDGPFDGDDDYEGGDPFGGYEEMWVDEQVRRVMGRGGLEAVSRMVSHEFGTPAGEFLKFVREQMPEVLQAKGPRAVDMVSQAVSSYGMYVEFREHDPEQAELMVKHDRMEMMSGELAENISILRNRARRDGSTKVKQALKKNEDQLKLVLNQLFELRQHQQEFEIRDLEAEVEELRELSKRRGENRDRIVERQFLELTGRGRALEW
jgi:hypothetical protein